MHTHAEAAVPKAEVGPVPPLQAGSPMQVPPGNASYLRWGLRMFTCLPDKSAW